MPVFSEPEYHVEVLENNAINKTLLTVSATDRCVSSTYVSGSNAAHTLYFTCNLVVSRAAENVLMSLFSYKPVIPECQLVFCLL